ncbi:MipA/OmpV family protein [Sulfitobacter sp. F26204]|uniref:MipA/OmpV family protein n=1 Tax=Sulfitobacter sp. F26204 TaxID=2996014 RepID=UPI00225E3DF6|nr:MipA/OmpV family protein [Sulfitobacter sp. F26204]MCX7558897.1 MipA/OmpV family protein [Sulfitobacter sp. F26204]
MSLRLLSAVAVVSTFAAVAPLAAQERSLNFGLGFGLSVDRSFFGADSYKVSASPRFTFGNLTWGRLDLGDSIGEVPKNGLSLGGAFRIVGSRDAEDNPKLAGLDDIDTAVELGLNLNFQQTHWRAFGEIRQGFGGHEGVAGTLGADVIFRPTDRWTVTAGPRLYLGDSKYAGTYYGVTVVEAANSNFSAYDADGGALGAGIEIGATYRIDDRWSFEGSLAYEKLLNDAADSPITQVGSDDNLSLRIGLSRAFTLNF